MSSTTRRVFALAGAIVFAIVFIHLIGLAEAGLRPAPIGVAIDNPAAIKTALEAGEAPLLSMLLLLGGWFVAGYFGGLLAWKWSHESSTVWLFAIVLAVIVFRELAAGHYPDWVWGAGIIGAPLFALGGGHRQISVSG
ncbi:MAG: hypothetical protein ABI542_01110 [Gemmatimonadota bacterium]